MVTAFYWWTADQIVWPGRLLLSFACSFVLHLVASGLNAFCQRSIEVCDDEKKDGTKKVRKKDRARKNETSSDSDRQPAGNEKSELGNPPKELNQIKHHEWLNRFLKEIWPRFASNCKLNDSESGTPLARLVCSNKLNLSKTPPPIVERASLVNRLDTSNGQVVVLDLIVTIDWSTPDNETLLSLSLANLQFTISSLHSIAGRLRLRVCLHYRRPNSKLYKLNVSLLEQPIIRRYETSGAAFLLHFFNLHLTCIRWLIANYLLFPRTLLLVETYSLDSLTELLRTDTFLDLDDLKSLTLQHANLFEPLPESTERDIQVSATTMQQSKVLSKQETKTVVEKHSERDLADKNLDKKDKKLEKKLDKELSKTKEQNKTKETVTEKHRSKESERPEQARSDRSIKQRTGEKLDKLKAFQKALNRSLKNKIARYVLHLTVMYSLNVPKAPLNVVLASPSYFVRIRIGDLKLTTNSALIKEPVLCWMQSFMVAACRPNWSVYLAILVGQSGQQTNDKQEKTANRTYLPTDKQEAGQVEQRKRPNLRECFEIQLTDNLEQFLAAYNGRLYGVEDEASKCRVTVRFSVFNLTLPIYKTPSLTFRSSRKQEHLNEQLDEFNDVLTSIGLPVGVLSLFISHLSSIEFISDRNKDGADQFCWLVVRSGAQEHLFRSRTVGNEQCVFGQSCFLLLFRPAVERVQFKVYFARSKPTTRRKGGGQTTEPTVNLSTTLAALHQPISVQTEQQPSEPLGEESLMDRLKNDYQSLAWCSLSLGEESPRYERIKLNGCLTDAYLHVYSCYGQTMNAKRLLRVMIDSEQTARNFIQEAPQ